MIEVGLEPYEVNALANGEEVEIEVEGIKVVLYERG